MIRYLCVRIKTARENGDKQRVLRQGHVGLQVKWRKAQPSGTSSHFIPLSVEERDAAEKSSETCKPQKPEEWRIQRTVLAGPHGEIEISGGSMPALLSLMANLRQEAE